MHANGARLRGLYGWGSGRPLTVAIDLKEGANNVLFEANREPDHDYHYEALANLREACRATSINCAVLLDTKGPEIRTGMLRDNKPVELTAG